MRLNIVLVLFILTFEVFSQVKTNTLLWKFYKKGQKPSYLYGTYHSRKITHDDYNDSLDTVIRRVEQVFVEIEQSEMDNSGMQMISDMMLPDNKTLKTLMSKKQYELYAKYAEEKIGAAYVNFDKINPLFVAVILGMLDEAQYANDTTKKTVDDYIESYAKLYNVKVNGLETVKEQLSAFKKISYKDGVDALMSTVEDTSKSNALEEELIGYYKNQELSKIEEMSHKPDLKKAMKMMQDPLLDSRNKIMLDRTLEFINKTNKSTLVAVGTMHLLGKTGLINALKENGYIVEPVK